MTGWSKPEIPYKRPTREKYTQAQVQLLNAGLKRVNKDGTKTYKGQKDWYESVHLKPLIPSTTLFKKAKEYSDKLKEDPQAEMEPTKNGRPFVLTKPEEKEIKKRLEAY